MTELWQLGALEIGRRIAEGESSAVEVLGAHLARVEEINPQVNAITAVHPERSRAAAAAADERRRQGRALSTLDGVPFSTKENLDCVGAATTEGVRALADNVVGIDAPVVERLRSAGAIPFARTNMPDFGLRIHTDNELHGPTLNPWNRDRTSGGSSGGEGVALATGMSPMGVGNDIGGSVRNPAYCAGVVSHKPTPHRLPRASVTPPTSWGPAKQLMSVNGPMARRVGDLQVMFSLMHGRHRRDPWSVSAPFQPRQQPGRIRVVANVPGGTTDPHIAAGVWAAAGALSDAGWQVEEAEPPVLEEAADAWLRWLGGEIALRRERIEGVMGHDARTFLDHAQVLSGEPDLGVTIDALTVRHGAAAQWHNFLADGAVLLGPVWTEGPFPVGFDVETLDCARSVMHRLRLIVVANVLGLPATSVPVGVGADGLPLGVQLIGSQYADDRTLAAAAAVESAFGVLTPIDPHF